MKVHDTNQSVDKVKCDMVAIGMFEGKQLPPEASRLGKQLVRLLGEAIKTKRFSGKKDEKLVIDTLSSVGADRVMLVGLGKKDKYDLQALRQASHVVRAAADNLKIRSVAFTTATFHVTGKTSFLNGLALAEGASLGQYRFARYKTKDKDKFHTSDLVFLKADADFLKGAKHGLKLAESVKWVRDIVSEPANSVMPEYLAKQATKLGKTKNIRVKVYDHKQIKKMGLNLIDAVGRASEYPPRFIVIELNPGKKGGTALVGKGITFDSGGLNLKPGQWMDHMKSDMGGAASVLGVIKTLAAFGYKKRVLGVIAAAENMVAGNAMRPGDVVKSYSGKTVEILNTDAEGRLVLGDAVAYTEKMLNPDRIIDIATLTGASISTLGYFATPIIGTDDATLKELEDCGTLSHERVWKLPIWDDYREIIKSDIADLRNIPTGKGYEAGVITGGLFIGSFVEKTPWSHLDIGATSWLPESQHYVPSNASGIPTRLLTYLMMGWLS